MAAACFEEGPKGRTMKKRQKESCWEGFLQLLFPRRCPVCDAIVVPMGARICGKCRPKLGMLEAPWCMKCGKKLAEEQEFCEECRKKGHAYIRGRILYEYESVAPSIYRMKYGGRREYADYFGEEMADCLEDFIRSCAPDALVPIPLHRKRRNQRGFNQAELLARAVGHRTGIPVRTDLLRRIKNTTPLKYQNPQERQNNLKKAFHISQNDVKLSTIIIVDDIYTTGSTLDAAAAVLVRHGVRRVYFIALAGGKGM